MSETDACAETITSLPIIYLYLLCERDTNDFKIGISQYPRDRKNSLSARFLNERCYQYAFNGREARIAEKKLHHLFRSHRVPRNRTSGYSEWFSIACFEEVRNYLSAHKYSLGWSVCEQVPFGNQRRTRKDQSSSVVAEATHISDPKPCFFHTAQRFSWETQLREELENKLKNSERRLRNAEKREELLKEYITNVLVLNSKLTAAQDTVSFATYKQAVTQRERLIVQAGKKAINEITDEAITVIASIKREIAWLKNRGFFSRLFNKQYDKSSDGN